jgi:GMP reductase
MNKALHYDDVALVPKYFDGTSRSELSTHAVLGNKRFQLPVIPANMKCVIDCDLANKLQSNNYFYVMHRFGIDNYEFVLNANKDGWNTISISVGIKDDDYNTLRKIQNDNLSLDYITVDVAHGDCRNMHEMLSFLKQTFPQTTIIAGNVGTPEAANELVSWGADVIKVGIGPGKSCITKLKTGFFTPMFSTVKRIREECDSSMKLIADGGIQHNGDIAKAFVAGADFVMAGSIFAQCVDSPGEIINGEKVYFGSASAENKGFKKNVEGKKMLLPSNGFTYFEKLKEIQEDLQSAMSYGGAHTVNELLGLDYLIV